ncbi:MAG TPA: HD domain-containing protein [Candidatus Obscuribacterales bacterium]
MTMSVKRSYLDPIHQDIILDRSRPEQRLIMDLIDTPEFQRLRRIHQLGVSYFTFQGAEGSRFTHSVGVMHITARLVALLSEKCSSVAELAPLILSAALLHDIGHGPYSHVTEKILGYDHEDWSCRIVAGPTVVNEILSSFNDYGGSLPGDIGCILKKTYSPHWVSHIVSSQLDCDRFDYLLRDSYMTGTAYGLFALQRILYSLEVDEAGDRLVVSGDKGKTAVEDYLFARYSMYQQVYYHKKSLAARALLKKLIERARQVGDDICFIDEPTRKLLGGDELTVSEYLELDDVQMTYHIKCWQKDKDPILSDLASRFINRRLPKALRVPADRLPALAEIEDKARQIAADVGLDPEYYVARETTGIRPYDYYRPDAQHPQTNIMVRTESGEIKELSTISLTVEALVKGDFQSHWIICPQEVAEKMMAILPATASPAH